MSLSVIGSGFGRTGTKSLKEALPSDRLLVFDVAEGWQPLCHFPGTPIPGIEFPHQNLRDDFRDALGGEPT